MQALLVPTQHRHSQNHNHNAKPCKMKGTHGSTTGARTQVTFLQPWQHSHSVEAQTPACTQLSSFPLLNRALESCQCNGMPRSLRNTSHSCSVGSLHDCASLSASAVLSAPQAGQTSPYHSCLVVNEPGGKISSSHTLEPCRVPAPHQRTPLLLQQAAA